jgi:hypothetical protein
MLQPFSRAVLAVFYGVSHWIDSVRYSVTTREVPKPVAHVAVSDASDAV